LQFDVLYTTTGVVLEVEDVAPSAPGSSSAAPANIATTAKPVTSGLRQRVIGTSAAKTNNIAKPILVAGWGHSAGSSELNNNLRGWENATAVPIAVRPVAIAKIASVGGGNTMHNNLASPNVWVGDGHAIGAPSTAGWMGNSNGQRVPVKILLPSLPRTMR
jgi:hypothetical protein